MLEPTLLAHDSWDLNYDPNRGVSRQQIGSLERLESQLSTLEQHHKVSGQSIMASMGHDSDSQPPSPHPPASGRKGSKKVRTGCITCKVRKVKCDESKPFCMRCTKTGRACDGYLDAKTIARRRRRSGAELTHSLTMFYELGASKDEKRSFHFFQHVTAPSLSGDFDGTFWRVLVLQICQTEPAVKHAILAVSSLHEEMVQNSVASTAYVDGCDRQSFALCQYNKAIACLLGLMTDADTRPLVPLLTCILFVCIEFMQNKDRESLVHLEQGRHILTQTGKKLASVRGPDIEMIKQHLVPMYTRLSLTAFMIGGSPIQIPQALKTMDRLPAVFDNIDQIRYALYDFMDECFRFTQRARPVKYSSDIAAAEFRALEEEQDKLLAKMAKFRVALSLYQISCPKDAPAGSLDLIQVHVHTTSIWIAMALSKHETAYDDQLSTFSAIVPLAASFIDTLGPPPSKPNVNSGRCPIGSTSTAAPNSSSKANPPSAKRVSSMFTFEIHFIAPLYYVATKCRHPLVRRAALDLLKRNPSRRENLWRAGTMAAIAESMINWEEKHLYEGSVSPPPDEYRTDLAAAEQREDISQRYDQCLATDEAARTEYSDPSGSGPGVRNGVVDAGDFVNLQLDMPVDPNMLLDGVSPVMSGSIFPLDDPTCSYACESSIPPPHPGGWSSSIRSTPSMHLEPPLQTHTKRLSGAGQPYGGYAPSALVARRPGSVSTASDASRQSSQREEKKSREQEWLCNRSLDPPFDLPEKFRVHEAIIGPEKDDGSWVLMFRKLNGLEGDWDVQTAYVPVFTA